MPLFRSVFRWFARLVYAFPAILGIVGVAWLVDTVVKGGTLPDTPVIVLLLLLAAAGPIIWLDGPRLVERITELGPFKFHPAEEELTFLRVLSQVIDRPEYTASQEAGRFPLTNEQRKEFTEFLEASSRIVDAIRTTTVIEKQPFWVKKIVYEVIDQTAYYAFILGRRNESLSYYEELARAPKEIVSRLEIDPVAVRRRYGTAVSFMASAFKKQGNESKANLYNRKAVGILEELTRDYPSDAAAHHNLGWLYDELGALADAIRSYDRALEINPVWPLGRYNLACALSKRKKDGDLERALNELKAIPEADEHWKLAESDKDLENLRADQKLGPLFKSLVSERLPKLQPSGKLDHPSERSS